MRQVPVVDVDHAIASVDFNYGRDERDHAFADRLDVRAFINGQPISEFHQGSRRPGLSRVNCPGDVVNRKRLIDQAVRFGIVKIDRARIGELG